MGKKKEREKTEKGNKIGRGGKIHPTLLSGA
jgi:hypothetical protein